MLNSSLKDALVQIASATNKDAGKLVEAAEKSFAAEKAYNESLIEKAQGDIMHGSNTGYGAEARTAAIYKDEMYSMINRTSKLLSYLPGNHGQIETADSIKVPIYGELDYFTKGSELVGNPVFISRQANDTPKTNKVSISFQKLQKLVSITKEELTRQPAGEAGMYARIENLIRMAFAKTIESFVINGDSDATTANINGVTVLGTWNTDHRNGIDGLRKVGIANGVVGASSAYSRATLALMHDILEMYNDDPDTLLWINSNKWSNKQRFDTTYSTQQVFNQPTNQMGGYVFAPEGITAYTTKDFPRLVATNGKVDGATPANNTQNGALLIYRPCVQYAYGVDLTIIPYVMSDGILFDVTGWFGFAIANELAGLGKTVAYGLCTN